MKRNLLVIVGIVIILISIICGIYYQYQKMIVIAKQENEVYEKYTENSILGSSLMTLINKAIDQNEENGLQKDSKNRYISNEKDSIHIEVKFLESEQIYDMEAIANLGAESFVKNYRNMKFLCTKKEYHDKTRKIKYMLFEQI